MKRTCAALLTFGVLLAAAPATAEPPCDIRTVTGTYAFLSYGDVWVGNPAFQGTLAPVGLFGLLTITPDSRAVGPMWGAIGATGYGLDPVPFEAEVTVAEDCTAELIFRYYPGQEPPSIEKMVVFANGKRMRGISKQTPPVPPIAWVSEYYRLGGIGEPSAVCGRAMGRGSWVMTCNGYSVGTAGNPPQAMSVSSALMVQFDVDGAGVATGTAMHKIGPTWLESPMTGGLVVHRDCTADMYMDPSAPLFMTVRAKGVVFDSGKQGFGMPLVKETSEGTGLMPPMVCRLVRQ